MAASSLVNLAGNQRLQVFGFKKRFYFVVQEPDTSLNNDTFSYTTSLGTIGSLDPGNGSLSWKASIGEKLYSVLGLFAFDYGEE